jgi:hypothetical protein
MPNASLLKVAPPSSPPLPWDTFSARTTTGPRRAVERPSLGAAKAFAEVMVKADMMEAVWTWTCRRRVPAMPERKASRVSIAAVTVHA